MNSDEYGNCPDCGGNGNCSLCRASGESPDGSSSCTKCSGRGKCPRCNGSGDIDHNPNDPTQRVIAAARNYLLSGTDRTAEYEALWDAVGSYDAAAASLPDDLASILAAHNVPATVDGLLAAFEGRGEWVSLSGRPNDWFVSTYHGHSGRQPTRLVALARAFAAMVAAEERG